MRFEDLTESVWLKSGVCLRCEANWNGHANANANSGFSLQRYSPHIESTTIKDCPSILREFQGCWTLLSRCSRDGTHTSQIPIFGVFCSHCEIHTGLWRGSFGCRMPYMGFVVVLHTGRYLEVVMISMWRIDAMKIQAVTQI
jgi:hypothetical protein